MSLQLCWKLKIDAAGVNAAYTKSAENVYVSGFVANEGCNLELLTGYLL